MERAVAARNRSTNASAANSRRTNIHRRYPTCAARRSTLLGAEEEHKGIGNKGRLKLFFSLGQRQLRSRRATPAAPVGRYRPWLRRGGCSLGCNHLPTPPSP